MLVLTRKLNEEIQIGHDVRLIVLRTKSGSVRLGIEAPREIRVIRGECKPLLNGSECSEQTETAGV